MNTDQKQQIAQEVKRLSKLSSQNKLANKAGVSASTVSQIINGNWDLIKDEMWRKVKAKLRIELDWHTAQTDNLDYIYRHLKKAQELGKSFGVSHDAGTGKSHAYKLFAKTHPNVIYIECMTYWKTKSYAKELVTACGLDDTGTSEELIERFIDHMSAQKSPMLIIDQMDKLKDPAMDLFIDFYNRLGDNCAFVLSGVPALEKRIKRGVNGKRSGYYELWSRIGRKWLKLKSVSIEDVTAVCKANGVDDPEEIQFIMGNCKGDLRRVRADVQNYFLNKKQAA